MAALQAAPMRSTAKPRPATDDDATGASTPSIPSANDGSSARTTTTTTTSSLVASYTSRDLILYALGIGCCSSDGYGYDDANTPPSPDDVASASSASSSSGEGRYVYELDDDFRPFPTFPLALAFTATATVASEDGSSIAAPGGDFGVRPFPPAFMGGGSDSGGEGEGPLPRRFLLPPPPRDGGDDDGDGEEDEDELDLSLCPAIHVAQSLRVHRPLPTPRLGLDDRTGSTPYDPPVTVRLATSVVAVSPKKVGTFVTTETEYFLASSSDDDNDNGVGESPVCTARSTALLVGVPPERVRPYRRASSESPSRGGGGGRSVPPTSRPRPPPQRRRHGQDARHGPSRSPSSPVLSMHEYQTRPEQALLYRLSGDYNPLHVDAALSEAALGGGGDAASDDSNSDKEQGEGASRSGRPKPRPILHGLCTLGFAVRAVLEFSRRRRRGKEARLLEKEEALELTYVDCKFVRPVRVGDALRVEVWLDTSAGAGGVPGGGSGAEARCSRVLFFGFRVFVGGSDTVVVDGGVVKMAFLERRASPRLEPPTTFLPSRL